MAEHIDKVSIFWSYEDALSEVEDEKTELELRRAIMRYAFTGEEPELTTGTARAMFKLMRPNIDSSRRNALNGGKSNGNRTAKAKDTDRVPIDEPDDTQGTPKAYPEHTQSMGVAYPEHTNKKEKEKKEVEGEREKGVKAPDAHTCANTPAHTPDTDEPSSPPPKKKQTTQRFIPPTVEEVTAYAAEYAEQWRKKHGTAMPRFDPERFVDYYAAKGWLVGKAKMKDWRAAVRNWIARDSDDPQGGMTHGQSGGPPGSGGTPGGGASDTGGGELRTRFPNEAVRELFRGRNDDGGADRADDRAVLHTG